MNPFEPAAKDLASVLEFEYFLDESRTAELVEDVALAKAIRGSTFAKTLQRVTEFKQRAEETLGTLSSRAAAHGKELEALAEELKKVTRKCESEKPGLITRAMGAEEYNKQVDKYNNLVDLQRRVADKAERARDRFQESVHAYEEKKSELEDQIRERLETLKPALDQDILSSLNKLRQLSLDAYDNRHDPYRSFLLAFFAKVFHAFAYDRISQSAEQRSANEVSSQLNTLMDTVVGEHGNTIKTEVAAAARYLHACRNENAALAQAVDSLLAGLPHDTCREHSSLLTALASYVVDTSFDYSAIIDPAELSKVEAQVRARRSDVSLQKGEVDKALATLATTFDSVQRAREEAKRLLSAMVDNKRNKLDPSWKELRFVLGVLDDGIQDRYLKKHGHYFDGVRTAIEAELGTAVSGLVREVVQTEMSIRPTVRKCEEEPAFSFLSLREQLQAKADECAKGVARLDEMLAEIDRQPREKSEELMRLAGRSLVITWIPLVSPFGSISLSNLVRRFLPALSGANAHFVSARERLSVKTKSPPFVLLGLTLLPALVAVFLTGAARWLLALLAITYGLSTLIAFLSRRAVTGAGK
jgi:hypothetical protein